MLTHPFLSSILEAVVAASIITCINIALFAIILGVL